jgi:hypothetical protein
MRALVWKINFNIKTTRRVFRIDKSSRDRGFHEIPPSVFNHYSTGKAEAKDGASFKFRKGEATWYKATILNASNPTNKRRIDRNFFLLTVEFMLQIRRLERGKG